MEEVILRFAEDTQHAAIIIHVHRNPLLVDPKHKPIAHVPSTACISTTTRITHRGLLLFNVICKECGGPPFLSYLKSKHTSLVEYATMLNSYV
ncbi:hypothetical protein CDAR_439001 [Caerostris darwini]|uniref:Uncharacterized protein n=1 Tax=Caerostris darwini TaxID=1538125 RepID=A0AAV4MIR4_9ARAC|nr:hypothetical protein CDAR_439001 [Caerostris darwini]